MNTPLLDRRKLLRGALGLTAATALPAALISAPAAALGQQPLRLVVGYAAGGPVDTAARQFAPVLARELGRSVIVDNRPGAGGLLAAESVAKTTPDGSLLYFCASPTLTISPHVLKGMTTDAVKALTPVAPLVSYANALVVNKAMPIASVRELIAYAKANPGKVYYGSAGVGSSNHLSGELFARQTGTQLTHVPYKGNAPAMTDVIGGHLTMMFDIVGTARNYVQAGTVRPLAVTSKQRNPALPEVPTMQEAGLPGYEVIGWYGLYGPARMADAVALPFNAAANRALEDPALRKAWAEQGYEPWAGDAARMVAQQRSDYELWRRVTTGMTFE